MSWYMVNLEIHKKLVILFDNYNVFPESNMRYEIGGNMNVTMLHFILVSLQHLLPEANMFY